MSHWTDILLDTKATNNIQFNLIDVIQAEAAQKWKATILKTERDPYVWYDLFIRPIKIIFCQEVSAQRKTGCCHEIPTTSQRVLSFNMQPHKHSTQPTSDSGGMH
jgi:hypothetical protein